MSSEYDIVGGLAGHREIKIAASSLALYDVNLNPRTGLRCTATRPCHRRIVIARLNSDN
jgi:hypothetical protein